MGIFCTTFSINFFLYSAVNFKYTDLVLGFEKFGALIYAHNLAAISYSKRIAEGFPIPVEEKFVDAILNMPAVYFLCTEVNCVSLVFI